MEAAAVAAAAAGRGGWEAEVFGETWGEIGRERGGRSVQGRRGGIRKEVHLHVSHIQTHVQFFLGMSIFGC